MPTPRSAGAFLFCAPTIQWLLTPICSARQTAFAEGRLSKPVTQLPKKFRTPQNIFLEPGWNPKHGPAFGIGLGSNFLILLHHLLFPVDPDRCSQSYGRNRTQPATRA